MNPLHTPLTLRTLLTKRQYAAFTAAWAELRGGLAPGSGSLTGNGHSGDALTSPDAARVRDLSWPERESTVLHLSGPGVSWILKTAGNTAYSVGREARARAWTGTLEARGTVARLLWYDDAAPLAILDYLPGCDVLGSPWELSPRVHYQAGAALALLHGAGARLDHGFAKGALTRTRARIAEIRALAPGGALPAASPKGISPADFTGGPLPATSPEGIPPAAFDEKLAEAEDFLASYQPGSVVVHPTHGDWQARNWLWDEPAGQLRVIDFGRFGWRPAAADFLELHELWQAHPELDEAAARGYREAGGNWPAGSEVGGASGKPSTGSGKPGAGSGAYEANGESDIERLLRVARDVGHMWHRATTARRIAGAPAAR
ncbi:aminoglycoside phosphotransferase family protein [Actinotignum sp. GS-2025c]|uniref:aminoglycoside phosphotransferase family protein n=1 Tax=Actinotignum sp. GS-2025c TaxID=3427276 RepID=UPI003F46530A